MRPHAEHKTTPTKTFVSRIAHATGETTTTTKPSIDECLSTTQFQGQAMADTERPGFATWNSYSYRSIHHSTIGAVPSGQISADTEAT